MKLTRMLGGSIQASAGSCALITLLSVAWQAQAADSKAPYPSMAPLDQYLMTDRNAEIDLARSAAPASISRDAEVLVLGRHGYETAVKGKNGFVCVVERSWMSPFDDPEFLNPDQRLPLCLNPPAARSHLPLTFKMTELALAGLSKTQMFDGIKAAFDKKELPMPEPGSVCYMMSKRQYFGRKYGNADPHLMFWVPKHTICFGAQVCLDLRCTCINILQSRSPSSLFRWPSGRTERLDPRISTDAQSQCALKS